MRRTTLVFWRSTVAAALALAAGCSEDTVGLPADTKSESDLSTGLEDAETHGDSVGPSDASTDLADFAVGEDPGAGKDATGVEDNGHEPDLEQPADVADGSELTDVPEPPQDVSDGDLGLVPGCGAHYPTIAASFERCPGGTLLGMTKVIPERIDGVTCTEVCCTFGFSACLHEGGADLGTCSPNPAPMTASCDHILQPENAANCTCE